MSYTHYDVTSLHQNHQGTIGCASSKEAILLHSMPCMVAHSHSERRTLNKPLLSIFQPLYPSACTGARHTLPQKQVNTYIAQPGSGCNSGDLWHVELPISLNKLATAKILPQQHITQTQTDPGSCSHPHTLHVTPAHIEHNNLQTRWVLVNSRCPVFVCAAPLQDPLHATCFATVNMLRINSLKFYPRLWPVVWKVFYRIIVRRRPVWNWIIWQTCGRWC